MPQVCADCHAENRSEAKFCRGCGRRLALVAASRTPLAPVGGEDWAATLRMPFEAESDDLADAAALLPKGRTAPVDPAPPSRRVPPARIAAAADPDLSLPPVMPRRRSQSRPSDLLPPLDPPNPLRRLTLGLLLLALLVGGVIWWMQRGPAGDVEAPPVVVPSGAPSGSPAAAEAAPPAPTPQEAPATEAAAAPVAAPAAAAPEPEPAPPVVEAPKAEAAMPPAPTASSAPTPAIEAPPATAAAAAPTAATAAATAAATTAPTPAKPAPPPRKPRKSATPAVAAAPAAAPAPAPEPAAAPAPPPPPSLQSVCGGLNFFSRSRCMVEQCAKADYKANAECVAVRRQQEIEEEKRNPQLLH